MNAPNDWFRFLSSKSNESEPHRTAFFATLWTMWDYKKDHEDREWIEHGIKNKLKGYHDDDWEEAMLWNKRLFGRDTFD